MHIHAGLPESSVTGRRKCSPISGAPALEGLYQNSQEKHGFSRESARTRLSDLFATSFNGHFSHSVRAKLTSPFLVLLLPLCCGTMMSQTFCCPSLLHPKTWSHSYQEGEWSPSPDLPCDSDVGGECRRKEQQNGDF